ncbi:MAG: hypothetical protein JST52_07985 [Bacteroidetes bacterium]|nr:hypothetical protein [Bacteroidota bacterium]MBS1741011.1 hypothetical protein [Bacteroidota bacterium]
MQSKFDQIPKDPDTQILLRKEDKILDYDVLFEFWIWDGISAVSAIFLKEDIEHLSDEEIIKIIQEECKTDKVTISRTNEKYLFANYGFKITEE